MTTHWADLCSLHDLVPNSGVCALFDEQQIALFYIPSASKVFAVSQYDPIGKANVISRGLVGSIGEKLFVASPLYKQHFLLEDGSCVEDTSVSLKVWATKVEGDRVYIQA